MLRRPDVVSESYDNGALYVLLQDILIYVVITICVFSFLPGVCVLTCLLDYAQLDGEGHPGEEVDLDSFKDAVPMPDNSDSADSEVCKAQWVLEMVCLVKSY